ncbi:MULTISPECIES: tyrosine-type recombinase/integrase [unclassified Sphingopyxis]|uniref:tyrosine-type recombinase/integrase n=1 Tax=unclassified Sphingopyxis TaxID=2614943 RepID=UPI00286C39DC|nr:MULTISPECIES: tyrosine-type recombinase/integrase [unclassified Sphingopyxis]
MAIHRFTDRWLQSLGTRPTHGRAEFVDAVCPGLHLRVTSKGTRTFSVMFRVRGKLVRTTLGKYPLLALHDAREAALAKMREVDQGADLHAATTRQQSLTLRQMIDSYVERHLRPNARSWKNIQAALLGSAKRPSRLSHLHTKQAGQISKADVVAVIDRIMEDGTPQAAVNLLRYIKMLFNWAADRDMVVANQFERIRPPARTRERDRILSDQEIAAIWHASFQLTDPYGQMYRMFLLTGQRRSEVATMRWCEISGRTWTIPREKVKKDRAHAVPLTTTAQAVLASLPQFGREAFVFTTTGGMSASSNFAKVKRELDRLSGTAGWTIHDIRRTVRSKLAELRIPREVARKVLNHEDGKVDRIYNRHDYAKEKREALVKWEKRLLTIVRS